MKNAFNRFISRLNTGWRKKLWYKGYTTNFQTKKLKAETEVRKQNSIQGQWDNYKRCNIRVMGIPEKEEKKRRNTWNNTWEFSQILVRYQSQIQESLHQAREIPNKLPGHIIFKLQKNPTSKILKEAKKSYL